MKGGAVLPSAGATLAQAAHPPRSPTDAPILALRGNDILKAWSRPVPFSIARGWRAGRPKAGGGDCERGWEPGPQRQSHGRAGLGQSDRRRSPQSVPAAPRLRRPRLPHRSGQCGSAPNAAEPRGPGNAGAGACRRLRRRSESWQVAREARTRLRGWVRVPGGLDAPGRFWAPASWLPYLPACGFCCAALGPPTPSLFVSSFFSFASSQKGSAWVLCSKQEFPS